jgi:hypothetical protein
VSGHDFSRAAANPLFLSSRGGLQPDEGSAFTTFSSLISRADTTPINLSSRGGRPGSPTSADFALAGVGLVRRGICGSTFSGNLFGRADKAFRSFLIPSEGWARFVSGHDFSRADNALHSPHPERASARGVDGKGSRAQSDGWPAPRVPLPELGRGPEPALSLP